MNQEIIIDETNFSQYFKDCRTTKPEKGDVMVSWNGMAELVEGRLKEDLVDFLLYKDKLNPAINLISRLGFATQKSSVSLCKEICNDALNGMDHDSILKKSYKYQIEVFYYTKKEFVPKDDPNWKVINLSFVTDLKISNNE